LRCVEQTATMNSPVIHSETFYPDQDDTSPWDQIQPLFAYSDQLPVEQPSSNAPASSGASAVDEVHPEKPPIGGACAVDEVHPEKLPIGGARAVDEVHPEKLPIKKTRPVKKQSRNELVRTGASVPVASRRRALRPDLIPTPPIAVPNWSIVERIGILSLMVVAVASVSVLLLSYKESLDDGVLPPSPSLAQGGPLPSTQATAIGSVMVDDRAATAADLARVASPGEIPTESDQPHGRASIPPEEPVLKAENNLRSVATEPMPPIPPERETLPATAAAIAVLPSGAPALSEPAVGLANDEMSILIKRGQGFLNEGDFAAARLLFERAANAGSAEAALALGSTYDPSVINQLGAISVSPDIDRALKWYKTAADRGAADAADRYAKLMRAR
jgi:hypothetical protein